MSRRVLIVFVDALGPSQLERLGARFGGLPHRAELAGVLGYSSGALATILTGASASVHGRMCLFQRAETSGSSLAPLRWMGLLPRVVHERGAFRRWVGARFAAHRGYTGYFALHKLPPEHFAWVDVPEREDIFAARELGGAPTFLARARGAGLGVYASPWQSREAERFAEALRVLERDPPDLAFLYAAELDGALHAEGNDGARPRAALARIERFVEQARERMSRGTDELLTLVVGDHGMSDIRVGVDPASIRRATSARLFVDATMARFWGSPHELERARTATERVAPLATWLGADELAAQGVPTAGAPYGDAIAVLPEGSMFAPSDLGGIARGMHGYALGAGTTRAALLSDAALPDGIGSLRSVAPLVERHLGLSS